jgi:hypothetical protein
VVCWHVSKHALQLDSFSKNQILWNNILSCGNKSMQFFFTNRISLEKNEKKLKHYPNSVILKRIFLRRLI